MSTLRDLRRATSADLASVIALQQAAYAKNRDIMGVEPMPLRADYPTLFETTEMWLAEREAELEGVLILALRADDLYIWSVAVAPAAQGRSVGNRLLAAAQERARQLQRTHIRLRAGEKLTGNVSWYGRHGFVIESVEQLEDRRVVHMAKTLG